MRKILAIAVAAVLAVSTSASASVIIVRASVDRADLYVSEPSSAKSSPETQSLYQVFSPEGQPARVEQTVLRFDCAAETFAVIEQVTFDESLHELKRNTVMDGPHPLPARMDFILEGKLGQACHRVSPPMPFVGRTETLPEAVTTSIKLMKLARMAPQYRKDIDARRRPTPLTSGGSWLVNPQGVGMGPSLMQIYEPPAIGSSDPTRVVYNVTVDANHQLDNIRRVTYRFDCAAKAYAQVESIGLDSNLNVRGGRDQISPNAYPVEGMPKTIANYFLYADLCLGNHAIPAVQVAPDLKSAVAAAIAWAPDPEHPLSYPAGLP